MNLSICTSVTSAYWKCIIPGLLFAGFTLGLCGPARAQTTPVRCDYLPKTTPGIGVDTACLDLVKLQDGGTAIQAPANATRIGKDGFTLCKSAFTVATGGSADIVFVYDNSSSMIANFMTIDPVGGDTIFLFTQRGCDDWTVLEQVTYQTLTGPSTIPKIASAQGCTQFAGDPYDARGHVIRRAIDFIAENSPSSTAGVTAFAYNTRHAQPLLPMNVAANVNRVKDSVILADEGGTVYRPPLELAKQWLTTPSLIKTPRQAIVFISDGAPSDSTGSAPYLEVVDAKMPPIYSIFMGRRETPDMSRLQDLSRLTKGTFNRVNAQFVADIDRVMQDIMKSLIVGVVPPSITITNISLVPPQVSKSGTLKVNSDGSVSVVLDSILALKQGINELRVKIVLPDSQVRNYVVKVNADGPVAGSSSSTLKCYDQPKLVILNAAGQPETAYPSAITPYTIRLTRTPSDVGTAVLKAISRDSSQKQPWGDVESISLPLTGGVGNIATNQLNGYPLNGGNNTPTPNNGTLDATPNGDVVLSWAHPRDAREFVIYVLPGGKTSAPSLDLYYAGVKLTEVTHLMSDLEIRMVFSPGDTCNACGVAVFPSGSADKESITLAKGAGYYTGTFIRAVSKAVVAGDGSLQHLATDSIILFYQNPRNPAEVVRRSYPFRLPPPVPSILDMRRHNEVSMQAHTQQIKDGKNWLLVGNEGLAVTLQDPNDRCCRYASWPLAMADSTHYVGVTVESSRPFRVDVKVYSNLGQFVGKLGFSISDTEFEKLPKGSSDSSKVLKILWDNRSQNGALAGTGGYVLRTTASLVHEPVSREDTRRVGLLRSR